MLMRSVQAHLDLMNLERRLLDRNTLNNRIDQTCEPLAGESMQRFTPSDEEGEAPIEQDVES